MCGRYQFGDDLNNAELQKIIEQLNRDFAGSPQLARLKTGEVFPTDVAPAVTREEGRERFQLMEWGFPRWNASGVVINARVETAAEKPMFREAVQRRRCLIPSTGFYEWQHHEDAAAKKEKYLLRVGNESMLYMAGIYNVVRGNDGLMKTVFAILTMDANQDVARIHDRMPVILDDRSREIWLGDKPDMEALLQRAAETRLVLMPAA